MGRFDLLRGTTDDGRPFEASSTWAVYASHLGEYMRRWIVRTPWGSLRLHNILQDDEGREPHNHPFDFTSLILRGGYREMVRIGSDPTGAHRYFVQRLRRGDLVQRRAEDTHRLIRVQPNTWTLVITGPKRTDWGFQTQTGWVVWSEYRRRNATSAAEHAS